MVDQETIHNRVHRLSTGHWDRRKQMSLMRKMMFTIHRSELGFDETIAALKESAQEHGWQIPMVHDLQNTYQEAGFEDMTRLTTIYLCNPEGGYQILQDDANKPMAVMMPTGVTVYETSDGEVHIAGMNLGRMSKMFGGTVRDVLHEGAVNYQMTLAGMAKPEPGQDIKVDGGRCCLGAGLGCVSLVAIAAALVAGLVFLASKLLPQMMPKMMAKMMPKMMEMMEEAGVQPPCAQIIVEHLKGENSE
jgi:uncharacterized protein (DUF302 family)